MRNSNTLLYGLGASGLFFGFPNPFIHLPFLVLLYPATLCLLALRSSTNGIAFRCGWITGLLGASCSLYWVAIPLHNVGGFPWVLAIPCSIILGIYIGLYGGIFCLVAKNLRHHNTIVYGIELGLIWYFLELIRGTFLTGFPWLTLSAAFVPWPFFIQLASIVGAYALSGIFIIGISWITTSIYELRNVQSNRISWFSDKYCAILAAILLYTALFLWGWHCLYNNPITSENDNNKIPVVIIEGNIDQNKKWDPSLQKSTVEKYIRLSQNALKNLPKEKILLVWPETAMPFYYQNHVQYGDFIRNFVKNNEVTLVLGSPGFTKNVKTRTFNIFNRAYIIDSTGKDAGFYDKKHLVPFGEYLPPLLDYEILKPLLQGIGNFSQGIEFAPLRSDKLALGILICYESIFPELAQKRVADNANILLNISNDAWFGKSAAAQQHLELTALRTVEQRRWLIRGTNTGISAIIDPFGRIVSRGGLFKEQPLVGYAKINTEKTVYYNIAKFLPYFSLALFIFIFILSYMLDRNYINKLCKIT